jgi:23S rRNA-/tRNA-specific pseudouridylate synthase
LIKGKPKQCIAVAELQVELLTGRTHQIRGQFAALGFPLVGDAQVMFIYDDDNTWLSISFVNIII